MSPLQRLVAFVSALAPAVGFPQTPTPTPTAAPASHPDPAFEPAPDPARSFEPACDFDPADSSPIAEAVPPVSRPPVRGGIYDRPFLVRPGRGPAIGGYVDFRAWLERTDGITEELGFVPERFNLFTFASVSDRVRAAAEIELEDGGEEVVIETAIVDLEIHEALVVRAGVLLSPLGRFNLAHDSPANDLVERPLVSAEILAATLSEPGMGVWGAVHPFARSRVSWEVYLVNGFDDRVILASEEGTRIAEGKNAVHDANAHPSVVGRFAVSPVPQVEAGLSGHRGPYNRWLADGERIDDRRDLALAALDIEVRTPDWAVTGEAGWVWIDVPRGLGGLLAERQTGFYLEGRHRFATGVFAALPDSFFVVAARLERVDFDADRRGDDVRRATLGVSFRPTEDTAFKVDMAFSRTRDRFALETPSTALLLGVASYF